MTDLVAFLNARYDEDEAAAKAWLPFGNPDAAQREHVARHDPARVLVEVDANRRTLELHAGAHECSSYDPVSREMNNCQWVMEDEHCTTMRLRGLPFADHPDYRQEWKP